MKKKILIGSMLVLTLLLLMPSIPAVQQKTIEDKAYSDLVEQLDEDVDADFIELLKDVDLEDLQEKIVNSETFKHLTSSDFFDDFLIVGFILGLITWIPALIFCILLSIPTFFIYSISATLQDFFGLSVPRLFLLPISIIIGMAYGISESLKLLILGILWPLYLAYFEFPDIWP